MKSTILRQYLEEREQNKNFSEDKFRNLLKELNLSAHQVNDLLIKMDDIQTETQLLNLSQKTKKWQYCPTCHCNPIVSSFFVYRLVFRSCYSFLWSYCIRYHWYLQSQYRTLQSQQSIRIHKKKQENISPLINAGTGWN